MLDSATIIDFAGALALLGMLSIAYGGLHRILPDKRWVCPVLGTLFGLLAVIQMHNPMEPFPGLIIDMRSATVLLAGAFLGGRGLLPCIVIAIAARIDIGGVGMVAGIAGLLIAGAVGLTWQGITQRRRRGAKDIGLLALVSSTHIFGIVLLPTELMVWFVSNATLPLVVMNLITVSAVAGLLERERTLICREETLQRTAGFVVGDGLMAREAFEWSLTQAGATGSLSNGASIIAIRIRFQGALARFWGKDADTAAMKVFHERLVAVMPPGGVVGWAQEDLVIMAIPRVDPEEARHLLTRLRRDVSATPIALPGMASFRLVLDLDIDHYACLPAFERLIADTSPIDLKSQKYLSERAEPLRRSRAVRQTTAEKLQPALFTTFDRLHAARFDGP